MAGQKSKASPATAESTPEPAAPGLVPSLAASAAAAADPAAAAGQGAAKLQSSGLRIKDLVDRVVAVTGGKKKDVKISVEAVLQQLGAALEQGEALNLPGLGRARVVRRAEKDGSAHLTLKLKRAAHKNRSEEGKEPLADPDEDG